MKCSIIKKKDGQLWQLHSDEYNTIGDARLKLSKIVDKLTEYGYIEKPFDSYDKNHFVYDVYTYKIVKSSSVHYDHSYGLNHYITIK